jgi:hypothetical protein
MLFSGFDQHEHKNYICQSGFTGKKHYFRVIWQTMPALSWNEIKARAAAFVNDWRDIAPKVKEEAEAQTFENEFFDIFGVSRKKVALFEKKVGLKDGFSTETDLFGNPAAAGGPQGYIDLFWRGYIIIEMKTPGKDLKKAYEQARAYANSLQQQDLPKGILICDFLRFEYYDLTKDAALTAFTLEELPAHVELFGYLAGYTKIEFKKLDPVNIKAAEKMGMLHNRLKANGYSGHQLEVYLVRLLFCLFADDTGIFDRKHFFHYVLQRTSEDGKDLSLHLHKIFETLNQDENRRGKARDEQLDIFPYVDGGLFEEKLDTADFDQDTRETLIDCMRLDWAKINPSIFGAMFQSVMNDEERHDIGAHYTSEENILKVIHPLFLDDLRAEFKSLKKLTSEVRIDRLTAFHDKLSRLKFLDPACGCGNFLVVSYRELRLLEMDVIAELLGEAKVLDVDQYIKVNVNQFYGIEIEEFPAKIAQTALWLMDHLMNVQVQARFGQYFKRIPLTASASIHCANALTLDWESVVPKADLSYILGNPPFLGAAVMSKSQKAEVAKIFDGMKDNGLLDYVTCWYRKAAIYIQNTNICVAFVSTNSICQGEQVSVLWRSLMQQFGVKINFAHQTFKWSNEARGKAAVYCVIVGFSLKEQNPKKLYSYPDISGDATETRVAQINAYLINAPMLFIERRSSPLCKVSPMNKGSSPTDDGNFFFTLEEKNALVAKYPEAAELLHQYLGAREYIYNVPRFCLWLKNISPKRYKHIKEIEERVEKVRTFRASRSRINTLKFVDYPTLFSEDRQPESDYLLIPRVSSEQRRYVPIGFISKDVIVGDACHAVPNATLYEFGIITSAMHMAWMRYVCGRLKSDFRYSNTLVYNNFPWPSPSEKQKEVIERASQNVLEARKTYPDMSLFDLYDKAMIPELLKAHQKLDKAVEVAYGREFASDSERVAFLFDRYQTLSSDLFKVEKRRGKGRKLT